MSKTDVLKTRPRTEAGSAAARRHRRMGEVPVNVYGHGEENQNLVVTEHELDLALASHTQVFTLEIGAKQQSCLVKSVQYDTFGQQILHVDFARVSLTEEVEVEVELEFVGDAKGVLAGGSIAVQHPALWVRCRADAIPDSIQVDISELELGQSVHAGEIALPSGVRLDDDQMEATDPIVSVLAPRVETEEEPTEEGAEGAVPLVGDAAPAEGEEGSAEPKDGEPKE